MLLRLLIVCSCALAFSPTPRRRLTPVRRCAPRPQRVGATMTAPSAAALTGALTGASPRAAAVAVGAASLARYHRALTRRESGGAPSWRSQIEATRVQWTRHVLRTEGWLYAIQALRNAITANTFLASTVLSLFTVTTGYLRAVLQQGFDAVVVVQFSGLLALLLCSAYNFSQAARLMTHAGFMFPVAGDADSARAVLTPASVEGIMVKASNCQWAGLRYLYHTLPVVAWILGGNTACGEYAFLAAALLLTRGLGQIDRAPVL